MSLKRPDERYIEVTLPPRKKDANKAAAWTPDRKKKHGEEMVKRWKSRGRKEKFIAKQIERKHPWRQAYTLGFGKPSPDYKIRI